MVIIQCQINNRILDGQLALFKICRIALRAYLDGAVLNNQIAAIFCPNSITAWFVRVECHIWAVLDDNISVVIKDTVLKSARNTQCRSIQRDCAAATRVNTVIIFAIAQVHGQLSSDGDVAAAGCRRRCFCFVVNTAGGLISACCGNGLIFCAGERDCTALRINAVYPAILRCAIFSDLHIQRCGDCDALICGNAIDITTTLRSHSQLAGAGDGQRAAVDPYAVQITGSCLACGKAAVAHNLNVQVAVRKNFAICHIDLVAIEVQRTAVVAGDIGAAGIAGCVLSTICSKAFSVAEADKFPAFVVQLDATR